jgi:hypothetical protein
MAISFLLKWLANENQYANFSFGDFKVRTHVPLYESWEFRILGLDTKS